MRISEALRDRLDKFGWILLILTLGVPIIPLAGFGLYLFMRTPALPTEPSPCLDARLVVPDAAVCVAFPVVGSRIWPKLVAATAYSTSDGVEVDTDFDDESCRRFIAEARRYGVSWIQLHDLGEAMVYREAWFELAWQQKVGGDFCAFVDRHAKVNTLSQLPTEKPETGNQSQIIPPPGFVLRDQPSPEAAPSVRVPHGMTLDPPGTFPILPTPTPTPAPGPPTPAD